MLQTKRGQAAALIAAAFALSACADSPTAPSSESAVRLPTTVARAENVGDACQTISFDGAGFVHGTAVTNQISVFGSVLTFTGQVSDANGNLSANTLRIYAGGTHQGGPDFDLQSTGAGALCGACTSNLLVINDPVDGSAALPSDAQWGGRITITGFPANTYISSYQLADHEVAAPPIGEPDSRLIVDGVNIAPAGQPQGQNTIITINTTQVRTITGAGVTFILGNAPTQQGSEAIDNIRVCQLAPPDICTYTKGWYQNKNGSPTVTDMDGRLKAANQAIFAATPGKPGDVTWGRNGATDNKPNNLLNLYQQLLAALHNLGGNPTAGPNDVDDAIADALAGTNEDGKGDYHINTTLSDTEISDLIETLSAFNEGKFAGFPHCTDEVLN